MPEQIIIGWDLETVPDLAAAARMLDLGNAAEADVRQALGSGFPKLTAIRIATIANRATSGGKSCSAQATHWLDLVTGVELCCFSVERAFLQLTLSNFKAALLQRRCRHLGFLLFRSRD